MNCYLNFFLLPFNFKLMTLGHSEFWVTERTRASSWSRALKSYDMLGKCCSIEIKSTIFLLWRRARRNVVEIFSLRERERERERHQRPDHQSERERERERHQRPDHQLPRSCEGRWNAGTSLSVSGPMKIRHVSWCATYTNGPAHSASKGTHLHENVWHIDSSTRVFFFPVLDPHIF